MKIKTDTEIQIITQAATIMVKAGGDVCDSVSPRIPLVQSKITHG